MFIYNGDDVYMYVCVLYVTILRSMACAMLKKDMHMCH